MKNNIISKLEKIHSEGGMNKVNFYLKFWGIKYSKDTWTTFSRSKFHAWLTEQTNDNQIIFKGYTENRKCKNGYNANLYRIYKITIETND